MKTFHFISGLPRSGSTLLVNLLNQNPDFHASPTSGLVGLLAPIKNGWHNLPELRAIDADVSYSKLQNVLKAVLTGFYADREVPYIFDKNRAWLKHIEMLNLIAPGCKFLVTVRDLRQILSSFEKLYRKTSALGIVSQELAHPGKLASVEQRALFWAAGDQLLGSSYNLIKDALARGFGPQIHFVKYDELCKSPRATFESLYNFLGIPEFTHDFENVTQVTFEDDRVHGFVGLHDIRSRVEYRAPDYNVILGKSLSEKFKGQELW